MALFDTWALYGCFPVNNAAAPGPQLYTAHQLVWGGLVSCEVDYCAVRVIGQLWGWLLFSDSEYSAVNVSSQLSEGLVTCE